MLLIKNGTVIDPGSGTNKKADVMIEGGRVKKIVSETELSISEEESAGMNVIDAKDRYILPGLVDVHVHFRDPGFTYKEDIESGAKAAAKGGFTTVVLMANTKPAVDNVETLRYVLEKGKGTGIHIETCAAVTMGMKGEALVPMEELKEAGAIGFTDDGIPLLKEELVRQAMQRVKELGVPLSFHEEDPAYIRNNGIHAGKASAYYGIGGSAREAEITLVQRDLQLALETGACVNIQHISTKEAVELVRQAKRKGADVHAEATPHHFTLNQEAAIAWGTLAKMNPPLREEEDRLAIIEGIKDGTIDLIATDHAPHSAEEKAKAVTEAPSGIIGLETALSLGYQELVVKAGLSMTELMEKMALHPARMYNLDAGYLKEGGPADLCIFDPGACWTPDRFVSRSQNSPFRGQTLKGVVTAVVSGGKIIYEKMTQKGARYGHD